MINGIATRYPVIEVDVTNVAKGMNKKEFAVIMIFVLSLTCFSECKINLSIE